MIATPRTSRISRIAIAVGALALIVTVYFSYCYLRTLQDTAVAKAHDLVETALEKAVGRPVRIGAISGGSLSSIELDDVVVPPKPDEGEEPILSIRQVLVNYSLLDVIFKRKPVAETITSVALVEPALRIGRAPDGRMWPEELFSQRHTSMQEQLGGFRGSLAVRAGRLEVRGIPGLDGAFVLRDMAGSLSFAGAGAGGRVSARWGERGELGLALSGRYDSVQSAVTCDAALSGRLPGGALERARNVLEEAPLELPGIDEGLILRIRESLSNVGHADLAGGTVKAEVHVRPDSGGKHLVRGSMSVAGASLTAADIIQDLPELQGKVNLVSDFQADASGLAYQGKGSISVERARCDARRMGLGEFEARGKGLVEFWQKPGEHPSFEGRLDLDVPRLALGGAIRRALQLDAGILEAEGPVSVALAFAGRAFEGTAVRGKLGMARGRIAAEGLLRELPSLSGDIGFEGEFARSPEGDTEFSGKVQTRKASVTTGCIAGVGDFAGDVSALVSFTGSGDSIEEYAGHVTILAGSARVSYPQAGVEALHGNVTGSVEVRGGQGEAATYSGTAKIAGANLTLRNQEAGIESFETAAGGTLEFEGEFPGQARYRGIVDFKDGSLRAAGSLEGLRSASGEARTRGKISFEGEYPGKIQFGGRADILRGAVRLEEGPGGLKRLELSVDGSVGFEGQYPGDIELQVACSVPDGMIEIVEGPGGLKSASGRIFGSLSLEGRLPDEFEYGGRLEMIGATVDLADFAGGIRRLAGEGSMAVDFSGGQDKPLEYAGRARMGSGRIVASDVPGGITSIEGPVVGTFDFGGSFPGELLVDGTAAVKGGDIVVGEIQSLLRSLAGRVDAEMSFQTKGNNMTTYKGRGVVSPATFVSDGVYPGLVKAGGPVRVEVAFSSSSGGEPTYEGKATVASAEIWAEKLFPGLLDLKGRATGEFNFQSTPDGAKYEGSAVMASGKALLGGAIQGFESMDGDIRGAMSFEGVSGVRGAFRGKATISGGRLKAGEIAKGVEEIEGPAGLELSFSGGVGLAPSYIGNLVVREASFRASEIVPGVRSAAGQAAGNILFTSNPDGPASFEGTCDISQLSFAAGEIYPGIRELGGNGEARIAFSKEGEGDIAYEGSVRVTRGGLVLDAIGSRLDNVAAEIDFDGDHVEIKGMTANFGKSRFEASGLVHLGKRMEIDIAVRSRSLALADLGGLVVAGESMTVSGTGSMDVAARGFYPDLEYRGSVTLSDASVEHPMLRSPVRDISGTVELSGNRVSTKALKMSFLGSPAEVRGEITDPLDPKFDLSASLADVDVSQVLALFAPDLAKNVAGRGRVEAALAGTTGETWTNGSFDLAGVTVSALGRSLSASTAQGKFRYGNGSFALSDTTVSAAGGSFDVSGVATVGGGTGGSPAARFAVGIKGVSLKEVVPYLFPKDLGASGTLDGELTVEGVGESYTASGSCAISSGSLAGYSFQGARADFRVADGRAVFQRLSAEGPDGDFDAKGFATGEGEIEAQVVARRVDLAKLARIAGYEGVGGGVCAFAGSVSVKDGHLMLDGLCDVEHPEVFGRKFDALTGRIKLGREEAFLDNVAVRDGAASCLITGTVGLGPDRLPLDLVARLNRVPVEDLMALAGMESIPLSGTLSGEAGFKGTVKDPEVTGSLRFLAGVVGKMKLDEASMDFSYASETLKADRLEAGIGSARIGASGVVTRDGGLDLSVSVSGLDLSKLPLDFPNNPLSSGIASFEGKVLGNVKAPQVEGRVSAGDVLFMGAHLPDVSGVLRWNEGRVEFAPLVIRDGTGEAKAAGTIGLGEGKALDLTLEADGLDIATILSAAQLRKRIQASGKVSGRAGVRGTLSNPNVDVFLEIHDTEVGGARFESAVVEASGGAGGVDVRRLQLRQASGGYLEAAGAMQPGGPVSILVSAKRFDASVLTALFGTRYALGGIVDLAAKVEGTSRDPLASLSLRILGGSVERVNFDQLNAKMAFRSGTLIIEEGEVSQGQHRASLTGRIPLPSKQLEALGIAVPKARESLDLNLRMKDASLMLLAMFSEEIEWADGRANVDLGVSGSFDSPRLQGSMLVSNGKVKLAPIADALSDVSAKITFAGSDARVERLSCRLGDGSVNVSGKIALVSEGGPRLDLKIASDRALINAGVLRALVNSSIALYGPARHPVLSGDIALAKAVFSPEVWESRSGFPFDADLALKVATEGDLRMRTKTIDVPVSGSLKLGGTLKEPQMTGRMEARRGWFAYFGNEFTIRRAWAEFGEGRGVMPRVELEAETSAGSTIVYIGLRGVLPGDLSLELSSSPPKSREEILALLNYPGAVTRILAGDVEGALREEITRIFDQELRLQVAGGISRAFEDMLSLDEVRLQRTTSNELTLRIGKYVIEDLYLSYEKGFGPESRAVLKFDYFYQPGIVLSGKFDDRGVYTFGVEARLRF